MAAYPGFGFGDGLNRPEGRAGVFNDGRPFEVGNYDLRSPPPPICW
jgi:hypothetical protein